ncbi:hypothetical protein J4Q44_G00394770 [Coregonus suidteri]|uniref:Uncharacterized protein n=1 Tax=Coregonus suidteri TaxID=861788 RepID=A0AAN8KGF6_9TELE
MALATPGLWVRFPRGGQYKKNMYSYSLLSMPSWVSLLLKETLSYFKFLCVNQRERKAID